MAVLYGGSSPLPTMAHLSASQAKSEIITLTDNFSWETVGREMIARMSGDEAREFLEHFITHFVEN